MKGTRRAQLCRALSALRAAGQLSHLHTQVPKVTEPHGTPIPMSRSSAPLSSALLAHPLCAPSSWAATTHMVCKCWTHCITHHPADTSQGGQLGADHCLELTRWKVGPISQTPLGRGLHRNRCGVATDCLAVT